MYGWSGMGDPGKAFMPRTSSQLIADDGSGDQVMGVGVGTPRNAPHLDGASIFGGPVRWFAPPTSAIVVSDDPLPAPAPVPMPTPSPVPAPAPVPVVASVAADDSGLPWWVWLGGAGLAFFAFKGAK